MLMKGRILNDNKEIKIKRQDDKKKKKLKTERLNETNLKQK